MTNSIILELNNICEQSTSYFKYDVSLSKKKIIQSLLKSFDNFNLIYENIINYDFLTKKEAKKLFKLISFLIELLNLLYKSLKNYKDEIFWEKWKIATTNIENMYDDLDVFLDDELQKTFADLFSGNYDKSEYVVYDPETFLKSFMSAV